MPVNFMYPDPNWLQDIVHTPIKSSSFKKQKKLPKTLLP